VVLTTRPNELLARVHDRMPVVIPDGLEEAWLEPADGPALRALEPLLDPWDPAAWQAVKLEAMPGETSIVPGAHPAGPPVLDSPAPLPPPTPPP
jgi:putative SOS response-associated peptidase YedK